jgi:hypothetical protein
MEAAHSSKMLAQIYDPKQNNSQEDNHCNIGRQVIKKIVLCELHFIFLSQSNK